jgi:hypothetical protein
MLYLRYTEGRIYSKIYAGFKDIYAVAEFVFKLPDDEMWLDCWDDKGNKLDIELRKIVTNRQKKVLEIKQRIKDLEKDFEDNT